MTTTNFKAGDRVGVASAKYPGAWIVESIGPKNTLLSPETGGRKLRVPHHLVRNIQAGAEPEPPPSEFYDPGELVRVTEGRYAGLYCVLKDSGADKVNLAKIGGDGGRYLRAMRGGLVRVDPAEVMSL